MAEQENGNGDRRFIDLDVDDINNHKSPKRLMVTLGAILIMVALTTVLTITARVIPYEPFIIYDYETNKTEYCPLEVVPITQDVELRDRWYFTNVLLKAETYMANEQDKPYGGTYVEVPVPAGEYPRARSESNTIRTAPPIPGEWYAGGKGVLEGRMFWIIPVQQDLGTLKSNSYTVKDWNEPECLELRGIDSQYGSSD